MARRRYLFVSVAIALSLLVKIVMCREIEAPPTKEEPRIVGGSRSDQVVPYQVSIQSRAVENIINRLIQTILPFIRAEWTHVCGGAIINEKYVLTAAHCIMGSSPTDLTVVAGTSDLAYRAFRHTVQNYVIHPNYREMVSSDLAVISVHNPFQFGPNVQKIEFDDQRDVGEGELCKFFGWGYLTPIRFGITAFQLQGIELRTISNTQCLAGEYPITDTEICTFRGLVQGLCAGDSGGALTNWDQTKIIGIASYSSQLCGAGLPDVYTRIAKFTDWIREQIGDPDKKQKKKKKEDDNKSSEKSNDGVYQNSTITYANNVVAT